MQSTCNLVAIDLGASGSRMILGAYDGREIRFIDEYRMANGFVRLGGALLWGHPAHGMKTSWTGSVISKTRGRRSIASASTHWGVDFVPLGREGLAGRFSEMLS